jgi:hypothetical protein
MHKKFKIKVCIPLNLSQGLSYLGVQFRANQNFVKRDYGVVFFHEQVFQV